METFCKLFGSLLAFVYHCFDRIVIQGYLPLLTRPEHIVHFFRDVHGIYPITKQALAKRTCQYQQWVEAFARHHRIPIQWPDPNMKKKDMKKEDFVRPYCLAMERRERFGVYFIFQSLEQGPTFRSVPPKFATEDPDYRLLYRNRSRYTPYYFYIRDEVLGPMAMCVGSFLPFQTTYYINAHHFIAGELQRLGVRFRRDDNAFLWVADVKALQAAADAPQSRDSGSPNLCPSTGKTSGGCPGYVIDHVVPLKRGGPDSPANMQWQTKEAAKAKDKIE